MNKISILLPIYNDEKYIEKSIKSVLNNTYNSYELVVINDGSTDSSVSIIESFNDNRIKIYNKSNSGLIDTLNYGLKKCENEIIMRMDGDDEIDKNKIEIQLSSFLIRKPIILGTGGYVIDNDSKIKKRISLHEEHHKVLKSMKYMKPSIIHASIMTLKSSLLKAGAYDHKFEVAEDYELFYRLGKLGELRNINQPLYRVRKNSENVSIQRSETQLLNTMIARDLYNNKDLKSINKELYLFSKQRIQRSLGFKLFNKVNIQLTKSTNPLLIIVYRLLRKILTYFI